LEGNSNKFEVMEATDNAIEDIPAGGWFYSPEDFPFLNM
jgi:hypothetical protein